MNSVAKNIKKLRMRSEMTQDALANKLNVTRQTVSSWESRRTEPDIDTLMSLASALDVDVNELIYGVKPEKYIRFQRKYYFWSGCCFVVVIVAILLHFALRPLLLEQQIMMFNAIPLWLYTCIVLPAAFFSAGMMVLGLISLWSKLSIEQPEKTIALFVGIILLIPAVLLIAQMIVLIFNQNASQPIFNLFGWAMKNEFWSDALLKVLPFISGMGWFLGTNK